MSVLPPRLLVGTMTSNEGTDVWSLDDGTGDPWMGYPYRWSCTFEVSPQVHASHISKTPFQYDATDIKIGDWFSEFLSGAAIRVVEITQASPGSITLIAEDVDRFNVFSDPTQQGQGIVGGQGAFFSLGDDGIPILSPMSANFSVLGSNLAWQMDQISRFRYRNYLRSNYPVHQAHDFSVGQLIRMTPAGYVKATASDSAGSVVGSVSDIGTPGPEWFTYRPVGRVVENVNPALPGVAGDLIYLGADGSLTAVKPNAWAKPVYIRLETENKAIVLDRSIDTVGKTGYSSQTYVVDSVNARNALTGINVGDQALVKDVGNGEWSHYIYEASNMWVLLVTQDASNVDSATKQMAITYRSDPSGIFATISTGRNVDEVIVTVTEAFDGTATLCVGTDADHDFLMDVSQNDLAVAGDYQTTPAAVLINGGMDTRIKYWLTTQGCTKGKATISITYS